MAPSPFGSGTSITNATSGTGEFFGVNFLAGSMRLVVPIAYTSNTVITGTSTYVGATLSSLGATPGTYIWDWGTGINAGSIILRVGP
jgi:hypothetical protein